MQPVNEPPQRGTAEVLLSFARTLRYAGVEASPDRVQAMITAVGHLDVLRREDVYWAGRLTLCGSPEDVHKYEAGFTAFFNGDVPRPTAATNAPRPTRVEVPFGVEAPQGESEQTDDGEDINAQASGQEVLRNRDFSDISPAERDELQRLFALLAPTSATRRSRRFHAARGGSVDPHRSIRKALRSGGEMTGLARRERRTRPRRIVILADVSGSMAPYSDPVLRFAHAAVRRNPQQTEVFTLGTRLTRVTRELRRRDPDEALKAAGKAIPDWSGGTRLGEMLRAFLDRWGQRGMARQAIAVVFSDGWERGDAALLGEQMRRLHRLAYRVVWVNPHKGHAGYEPLTAGIRAALPYVDDFVAGHSFNSYAELAQVIGRA